MAYAAERGRQLTVFQNRRFNGDFLTVRRLVREGRLGQIHRFDSRFEWYKPDEPKLWKAHTGAEQGGGILYDLGPHLIDQALRIFGPAVHSYAELARYRQGEGADDEAFLAPQLASSILDGAPLPVDPAESLAGIELIETVYAETATVRR